MLLLRVLTREIENAKGMQFVIAVLQICATLVIAVGGLVASGIDTIKAFKTSHIPYLSPKLATNMYYYDFASRGTITMLETYSKAKEKRKQKVIVQSPTDTQDRLSASGFKLPT